MATVADILQAASNTLTGDSQKPDFAKGRTPFEELMDKPVGFARQHSLISTPKDTLGNHREIGQPLDQGAPSVAGPATVKDLLNHLLNQAPKQQPQINLANLVEPFLEDRLGILTTIGANLRKLAVNHEALNARIDALKDAPADMKPAQATDLSQGLANQAEWIRQTMVEVAKVSNNAGLMNKYDHKLEKFMDLLAETATKFNDYKNQNNLPLKDHIVPGDLRAGRQQPAQPALSAHTMTNLLREEWKLHEAQNNGSNRPYGV